VIVGLMHEDVGHLGIFVSGSVANKEHAQIVSVLKSIESLPPGLYGMRISERKAGAGRPAYDVSFQELRLEEIVSRLNRFKRVDEKPFEAANVVAEFNQRAYELFGRPLVRLFANEYGAKLAREFHPLRFQRWVVSDLNPCLWWLAPAAQAVKAQRQAVPSDDPLRTIESIASDLLATSLDCHRDLRDATAEAAFFELYGNLFAFYFGDRRNGTDDAPKHVDAREIPFVKQALAAIDRGGYAEALARVAYLLAYKDEPLPLSRLQLAHELIGEYRELLPELTPDTARRVGGEQEIIARYEPERAVETLPVLLADPKDRDRLLTLLERVISDKRVQRIEPTEQQRSMLTRIRGVLGAEARAPRAVARRNGSRKRAVATR
jgi:hypothetical protein